MLPTKTICYTIRCNLKDGYRARYASNFDFVNWFPKDSYLAKYFRAKAKHFPNDGIYGKIYVVDLPDIEQKLSKLQDLVDAAGKVPDLEGNKIKSFLPHFFNWFSTKATLIINGNLTNQDYFDERYDTKITDTNQYYDGEDEDVEYKS